LRGTKQSLRYADQCARTPFLPLCIA